MAAAETPVDKWVQVIANAVPAPKVIQTTVCLTCYLADPQRRGVLSRDSCGKPTINRWYGEEE